jgi:hypothetical protein
MLSALELYGIVSQSLSSLWKTIITGGTLAIAGWVGAYYFARLWNRSFRLRPWHHLLCGMAAIITIASALVWVAVSGAEDAAETMDATLKELATNEGWQREAFERAYEAMGRPEKEDFSDADPYRKQERRILLTDSISERAAVRAYVKHAIYSIEGEYPQLEPLLRRASGTAIRTLVHQLQAFSEKYISPVGGTAQQMTSRISGALLEPVRLWLWRTRLLVAGLFLVTQTLAFGAAGLSAVYNLNV